MTEPRTATPPARSASAAPAGSGSSRVLLRGVSWKTYEGLLADLEARSAPRLCYDRGWLEIMAPSRKHERIHEVLGQLVVALCTELGVPFVLGGSTTFRREALAKGIEPDKCYWIASAEAMRGREDFDFGRDPPPDLAIEADLTSSSLDKLGIYAALGVPEVWRHDDGKLTVLVLDPATGEHAASESSRAFPTLPIAELERFLAMRDGAIDSEIIAAFRGWARGRFSGPG